ncbi:hypothetical protein LCGC14_1565780, partial [marine sediment metagenome]
VYLDAIVLTSIDDSDFADHPYTTIAEGGVVYKFVFKDTVDLTEISEDDPLELSLLGREVKIIEASASEITLRSGQELSLLEGEKDTVEGKVVKAEVIGENSVSISVAGVSKTISEDEELEINGLKVRVENILYKGYEGSNNLVDLLVGIEIDEVIKDGEYFELFEKDSEEWEIGIKLGEADQYISVKNVEAYKDIDEDSDYKALGVGDTLALPNNYLEIEFKSVSESELNELNFKVKDGYLYVRGDSEDTFSFGTKEYDRLYIDDVGIYDEDLVLITDTKVEIGDSSIYLELGSAIIENLKILADMTDILFNGISFSGKDETYMDYLGIIFSDAENAVEDKTGFKVTVPEELPEVLISFNIDITVVITPPVDDEEDEEEDDVVVVPPPVIPPVVDDEDDVVIPPVVTYICADGSQVYNSNDCPIEPESNTLKTVLISLIAAIIGIFAWGKGFAGLIKYYLRLADEAEKAGDKELAKKYRDRASKMAKTVVTNYLAGKYKK